MSKPWDIPIGALVRPCAVKTSYCAEHPTKYNFGIVTDRAEYDDDDLAGPISYQVWWNHGETEWWMPDELVVIAE